MCIPREAKSVTVVIQRVLNMNTRNKSFISAGKKRSHDSSVASPRSFPDESRQPPCQWYYAVPKL